MATNTKQLPKVNANEITPGMTIRFNTTQVRPRFRTEKNEHGYWKGEQLAADTDYNVASVEAQAARTHGGTGRGGREYIVTLTDGQSFAVRPQQKVHVAPTPEQAEAAHAADVAAAADDDDEGATPCTDGTGTQCTNDLHDHLDYVDANGNDLGAPRPMVCNDCGVPTHYDRGVEQYRHDSPDDTCWLTLPGVATADEGPDENTPPAGGVPPMTEPQRSELRQWISTSPAQVPSADAVRPTVAQGGEHRRQVAQTRRTTGRAAGADMGRQIGWVTIGADGGLNLVIDNGK